MGTQTPTGTFGRPATCSFVYRLPAWEESRAGVKPPGSGSAAEWAWLRSFL